MTDDGERIALPTVENAMLREDNERLRRALDIATDQRNIDQYVREAYGIGAPCLWTFVIPPWLHR